MNAWVVAAVWAAALVVVWLVLGRRPRQHHDEQSFDDHCDQALHVVADDLDRRRVARAVGRHPVGRRR